MPPFFRLCLFMCCLTPLTNVMRKKQTLAVPRVVRLSNGKKCRKFNPNTNRNPLSRCRALLLMAGTVSQVKELNNLIT